VVVGWEWKFCRFDEQFEKKTRGSAGVDAFLIDTKHKNTATMSEIPL